MTELEVKVGLNLRRLLNQEDLDQDLRITIEDRGLKLFLIENLKGKQYEISAAYLL